MIGKRFFKFIFSLVLLDVRYFNHVESWHNFTSTNIFLNTGSVIDTEIRGLNDKITRLENTQNLIGIQVNQTIPSLSVRGKFFNKSLSFARPFCIIMTDSTVIFHISLRLNIFCRSLQDFNFLVLSVHDEEKPR